MKRLPNTAFLLPALLLAACAGEPPRPLTETSAMLEPCPPSPNCVSSLADDEAHRVTPFKLAEGVRDPLAQARAALERMPRTRVVEQTSDGLRAEARSLVFRFVDDLVLRLDREAGVLHVRSASRKGHSDLGVNRRRVERLRAALVERGVVLAE